MNEKINRHITSHKSPSISHTYGSLLAHEWRIAGSHNNNMNMVHLNIIISSHNKEKYKTNRSPQVSI
jgi:hypothetical protein